MMKNRLWILALASIALLPWGCAGGNSMETENILQGTLLLPNGNPIAQAPVQICKHTEPLCAAGVVGRDTTDAQGLFHVALPEPGVYDVVVEWNEEILYYPVTVEEGATTTDIGEVELVKEGDVPGSSSSQISPSSSSELSSSMTMSSSSASSSSAMVRNCVYTPGNPVGELACPEQTYQTVVIGEMVWTKQNMNIDIGAQSSCYNNLDSNCVDFGRLYTWAGAQQACPVGWRLPTDSNFTALEDTLGGLSLAGQKLKANDSFWDSNTGTDDLGFSALPGGAFNGLSYSLMGQYAHFWTSTEYDSTMAWGRSLNGATNYVTRTYFLKKVGYSVRCVRDL